MKTFKIYWAENPKDSTKAFFKVGSTSNSLDTRCYKQQGYRQFGLIEECYSIMEAEERETYWQNYFNCTVDDCKFSKTFKMGTAPKTSKQIAASKKAVQCMLREDIKVKKAAIMRSESVQQQIRDTKIKNGTLNSSTPQSIAKSLQTKKERGVLGKNNSTKMLVTRQHNSTWKSNVANAARENGKVNSKPVDQYSKENTFIQTFPSAQEAGRVLQINPGDIAKVCKGKGKTCGSFIWKYSIPND